LAVITKEETPEEQEIKKEISSLESRISKFEIKVFLSGPYDKYPAILSLRAGQGGKDAEDWTAMLYRMYQRYCQSKGFKTKVISQDFGEGGGPEGRIGIKEVLMEVKGKWAFGLLKGEQGVHRLVRISPFSANSLRHTSFSQVTVTPELPQPSISKLEIKPDDLKIETFRASGPGGQYVNKRESAVRITHLPTGIRVMSQSERFQGLNREIAMKILKAKLLMKQEEEKEKELTKLKRGKVVPTWGHQIRSYILHPYKLVKDQRTKIEESDIESVLDGNLDKFIEAEIRM